MGVQKDSGELLKVLYKKYIENPSSYPVAPKLAEEIGWEINRVIRAILYLDGRGFIISISRGNVVDKILPDGIDTIENPKKYKATFGINLGVFTVEFSRD